MSDAHSLSVRNLDIKKDAVSQQMQQFCALSDRLDHVAEMHYRCAMVAKQLHAIFKGTATIWIFNKCMGLVKQLFMMFVLSSEWLTLTTLQEVHDYPMDVICYSGLMAGLIMVEIYMFVTECTRAASEV